MTTSPSGAIEPQLATSYTVSTNGLVYTFHLRHNVYFQNGQLLTSADVAYTFQRLFSTGSPSLREVFPTYQSVRAIDSYTVDFTLSSAAAGFALAMASPIDFGCAIINKQAAEAGGLAAKIVATGPWTQVSYEPNVQIILTRNTHYWGTETKAARLDVQWVPEGTTQVTDLEAGRVDLISPSKSGADSLAGAADITVKAISSDTTIFLMLNANAAPFNNLDVRRAVALALDRSALAKIAYAGGAVPSGYVPPSYAWGTPISTLPYSQYNPTEAKQLLSEAGYPNGLTTTIKYIDNYEPGTNALLAQMQSELAAVGISAQLVPLQAAAWIAGTNTNADFGLSWNEQGYYADPYLYVAVSSYRIGPGKGEVPAALQALITKALDAQTIQSYEQGLNAVGSYEASQVYPQITLLAKKAYVAYRTDLSGVSVAASGSLTFLANVSKS
jgi:peptide/nickel transport system substrate-binding protein